MATSTPLADAHPAHLVSVAQPGLQLPSRSPLVYWHLLSLDAPTVAMLWTWFIAKTSNVHLHLPATSILAMGIAVWTLYAADRLLDSHSSRLWNASRTKESVILSGVSRNVSPQEMESKEPKTAYIPHTVRAFQPQTKSAKHGLEPRHLFHRHYRSPFLTVIGMAVIALAYFIPRLPTTSLELFSILGTLLAAYFLLIHLKQNLAPRLQKEIAVGIFFSAATFIPTVARDPGLRPQLLPAAILFGLACSLNCLFIYAWEHPFPYPEAHTSTRLALRVLLQLSTLIILSSITFALCMKSWQLPAAIAIAASLLVLLHANRHRLSPTTLRAAADLCLLTPILFAFKR